jgi:hypothetical protein
MIIFAAISIHAFQPERRPLRGVVASAALVSVLWCFIPSFAQDTTTQGMQTLGSFNWKKDASTGNELAASRSDSSFNYFDIGDLSYDSQSLVEQDLRRLSAAAGLTIDHTPAKNSSVSIVHDTKVFAVKV